MAGANKGREKIGHKKKSCKIKNKYPKNLFKAMCGSTKQSDSAANIHTVIITEPVTQILHGIDAYD